MVLLGAPMLNQLQPVGYSLIGVLEHGGYSCEPAAGRLISRVRYFYEIGQYQYY